VQQLEAAYHAAEEAQASLRREHESARASFYTDEEFRTLQAQVSSSLHPVADCSAILEMMSNEAWNQLHSGLYCV
jgi:hypothetical protein